MRVNGCWVFVCGPSGAGKDSVLRWADAHLSGDPRIVFARRLVTRPPQIGSEHEPVTAQQYARLMGSGALAWAWQAHGFHYGVRSSYSAEVAAGRVVVVNGSREHIASQDRSAQVRVVQVLADQTALAERLHARGRDDPQAVSERLQRNQHFQDFVAHCHILNEGDLALAGQRLVDYLNEQLADTRG